MARAVAFYEALGVRAEIRLPGGELYQLSGWQRLSQAHVSAQATSVGPAVQSPMFGDLDAFLTQAVSTGLRPEFPPRNGSWGERYFRILDPDGHELSFARPI